MTSGENHVKHASNKIKVGILGTSGYGGAELLRRLARHPQVEISGIGSRQFAGQKLGACWPQFAGDFPNLCFTDADKVIENSELIFSAAPHGQATHWLKKALESGKRVIDLSADFRLSPDDYQQWYHMDHPYPELYSRSVYGLVELHREELADAELVANPGCYPTTASLALAPLAAQGLLGRDIIVSAASGVSGAGRGPSLDLHYTETNENFRAYNVAGNHRHTIEIENTLGRISTMGRKLKTHLPFERPIISFTPHLVPMTRGILASCHTRPEKAVDEAELFELYRDFYQDDLLIIVSEELPQTKAVYGSDRCIISVRFDPRSQQIIALATIDNLGKGAAGQAMQNFNLMHGFEETLGLALEGVWP